MSTHKEIRMATSFLAALFDNADECEKLTNKDPASLMVSFLGAKAVNALIAPIIKIYGANIRGKYSREQRTFDTCVRSNKR